MASKFADEVMIAYEEYRSLPDKTKDLIDLEQYMEQRMDYNKNRKSKKCEEPSFDSFCNNLRQQLMLSQRRLAYHLQQYENSISRRTSSQNKRLGVYTGEVSKSLYDEFDRHADLIQEDTRTALGNVSSTSTLQGVFQEASTIEDNSDFHDSNDETLHEHETTVFSHVQSDPIELSHEGTLELSSKGALCDTDSCHDEFDFSNQTLQNKTKNTFHDIKIEEEQVMVEDKLVTLEQLHDDKEILQHNNNMGEPKNDIHNIPEVVISANNSSDFYDSSEVPLQHHEITTISYKGDISMEFSKAYTQDLSIIDALCVEDSCHHKSDHSNQTIENESENLLIGDGSQDCSSDGHIVTVEVEVCEDIVKTTASTMSFEPSYEVQSNNTLNDIVCEDESIHDAAYHIVSDNDSTSYHSADDTC